MNEQSMTRALSPRQQALLDLIRGLSDSELRRLKIACRGNDPWEVIVETESTVSGLLQPRSE